MSTHHARFETLCQYIDNHLTHSLRIEELTQVAHMSERTLYHLFKRAAGTSPQTFIRARKLDQVRQRLQEPGTYSVTAVALDHGFPHLGRFADTYRKRFGELPSQTWKRYHPVPTENHS